MWVSMSLLFICHLYLIIDNHDSSNQKTIEISNIDKPLVRLIFKMRVEQMVSIRNAREYHSKSYRRQEGY